MRCTRIASTPGCARSSHQSSAPCGTAARTAKLSAPWRSCSTTLISVGDAKRARTTPLPQTDCASNWVLDASRLKEKDERYCCAAVRRATSALGAGACNLAPWIQSRATKCDSPTPRSRPCLMVRSGGPVLQPPCELSTKLTNKIHMNSVDTLCACGPCVPVLPAAGSIQGLAGPLQGLARRAITKSRGAITRSRGAITRSRGAISRPKSPRSQ